MDFPSIEICNEKDPLAYKLICKMQVPKILCKIIHGQNTSMIHITVTQYQSDTMDFSLLDLYIRGRYFTK